MAALDALEVPVNHWDLILLPILSRKLDVALKTQWEMTLADDELPSLDKFVKFLVKHCRCQEAVAGSTPQGAPMQWEIGRAHV